MRGASYEVVESTPTALTIRDVGKWDQHPTVTNDAEAVVGSLLRLGRLKPGMRLFYYDSDGRLDELVHDGAAFTGFAPGPKA